MLEVGKNYINEHGAKVFVYGTFYGFYEVRADYKEELHYLLISPGGAAYEVAKPEFDLCKLKEVIHQ